MSPEQTIALAVACGAETITEEILGSDVSRNYVAYIMTAKELHNMATRIAQQAIDEHLAKLQGDWLQSGNLVYRLTDERRPKNCDEIWVTLTDGSRDEARLADAASTLRMMLAAKQQESAPVLPELPPMGAQVDLGDYLLAPNGYTATQMREYALAAIAAGGAK